jgi:hypothetical protein
VEWQNLNTNRTPINRPPTARFTPKAISIFKHMMTLQCTCRGDERFECSGCKEHDALDGELARELNLKPWQYPAVIYPFDGVDASPTTATHDWETNAGRRLFAELVRAAKIAKPPQCGPWERPVRRPFIWAVRPSVRIEPARKCMSAFDPKRTLCPLAQVG